MRKYMLLPLFVALLMLLCVPALAQTYAFDDIYATVDLPSGTYDPVLTPSNLSGYETFLASQGTDAETAADDFAAQGILLKAFDT